MEGIGLQFLNGIGAIPAHNRAKFAKKRQPNAHKIALLAKSNPALLKKLFAVKKQAIERELQKLEAISKGRQLNSAQVANIAKRREILNRNYVKLAEQAKKLMINN